jgi:hypothetical protein
MAKLIAKGKCPYCHEPVWRGGLKYNGDIWHKSCYLSYEIHKLKSETAIRGFYAEHEPPRSIEEIDRLPVEERVKEFLKGYLGDIRANLTHASLQKRLEEIGTLLGYITKRNYPEPQSGWEYDVIWKEAEKLPPSHAYEVQDKGNLDSALVKLKHAKDIWRPRLFLIATREHDRAKLDRILDRHFSGAFHEISSLVKVLTPEDVIDAWQSLFNKWSVLKDFLTR